MEIRNRKQREKSCKKSSVVVQDLETKGLLTEGKWKTTNMVEDGAGIVNEKSEGM